MVVFSVKPLGYSQNELEEFLRESNAIEGVFGQEALDDSVRAWGFLTSDQRDPLNPFLVMQTHELLMERQPLEQKYKGQIRDIPIYIGNHEGMRWQSIPFALEEWCNEMNKARDLQPEALEELSKKLHVDYERIHPFVDGNGRTGRMFMNHWRLQQGLPLLIIHAGPEQYEYYKWFV